MKNTIKFIGALLFLTAIFAFTNSDKKIVVIDVSHGGKDYGATFDEFKEKEITLNIAQKIKELNENSKIEIILTRDTDKFLSLSERAEYINNIKPDYVISLHVNASKDGNKNGMEIFVSNQNKLLEKSEKFARDLLNNFETQSVEIKNANFHLLANVSHPINLFEIGYLTNSKDREYMTSEIGQTEIANAILKVVK